MARNVKPGITFYRMDSGHILNKKIRLLFNECGADGYYIWSAIIDKAYAECGYYFNLNDQDELELFATEYCKMPLDQIKNVIQVCIKRELFNADIAAALNILISPRMQRTFVFASVDRRKKGSIFNIPKSLWMLDLKELQAENINISGLNIVADLKFNLPGRIPQTIDYRPQTETIELFGPSTDGQGDINSKTLPQGKTREVQGARREKNIPIPPNNYKEVEDYFLLQYNPKASRTWFPDTCRRHAADFWDFYETNGWVQANDQKPIQKWMNAANKWIRNARAGIYQGAVNSSSSAPAPRVKGTGDHPRTSTTNVISRSINFLYEKFQESPALVSMDSVEVSMYQHMKDLKLFNFFTDQKVTEIHAMAVGLLKKRKIEQTDPLINGYMKRIAVIELFKQYNTDGRTEIFKL